MSAGAKLVPCTVFADDKHRSLDGGRRDGRTYWLASQLRACLSNIHELILLFAVVAGFFASTTLSRRGADIVYRKSRHF